MQKSASAWKCPLSRPDIGVCPAPRIIRGRINHEFIQQLRPRSERAADHESYPGSMGTIGHHVWCCWGHLWVFAVYNSKELILRLIFGTVLAYYTPLSNIRKYYFYPRIVFCHYCAFQMKLWSTEKTFDYYNILTCTNESRCQNKQRSLSKKLFHNEKTLTRFHFV